MFGCIGSEKDTAPPENKRYLADVLVPAYPITQPAARSRPVERKWVGRGERDVCGNSWSIELKVAGNKVSGEFWLRAIKYEIVGFLDANGRMDAIPGIKSRFYRNYVGPRVMEFSVAFSGGEAKGEHYFFYGRCRTPMRLIPVK